MMVLLGSLERFVLGALGALVAVYLLALGWSVVLAADSRLGPLDGLLAGILGVLALDLQVAVLLVLLGPNESQEGLVFLDVRLRNVLGTAASVAVWIAAGGYWMVQTRLSRRLLRRGS